MFGDLVKRIRADKRLGLREFCINAQVDPSNWSKIERGLLPPPTDNAALVRIATALGASEGSNTWNELFDQAQIGAGRIPDYVLADNDLVKKLPIFFRTVGGKKPTRQDLEKLVNILKEV